MRSKSNSCPFRSFRMCSFDSNAAQTDIDCWGLRIHTHTSYMIAYTHITYDYMHAHHIRLHTHTSHKVKSNSFSNAYWMAWRICVQVDCSIRQHKSQQISACRLHQWNRCWFLYNENQHQRSRSTLLWVALVFDMIKLEVKGDFNTLQNTDINALSNTDSNTLSNWNSNTLNALHNYYVYIYIPRKNKQNCDSFTTLWILLLWTLFYYYYTTNPLYYSQSHFYTKVKCICFIGYFCIWRINSDFDNIKDCFLLNKLSNKSFIFYKPVLKNL